MRRYGTPMSPAAHLCARARLPRTGDARSTRQGNATIAPASADYTCLSPRMWSRCGLSRRSCRSRSPSYRCGRPRRSPPAGRSTLQRRRPTRSGSEHSASVPPPVSSSPGSGPRVSTPRRSGSPASAAYAATGSRLSRESGSSARMARTSPTSPPRIPSTSADHRSGSGRFTRTLPRSRGSGTRPFRLLIAT
jgi:hypothetical protein